MNRRLALPLLILLLAACTPAPPEHRDSQLVFGTLVDVTLYGTDAATAQKAFRQLRQDFELMHFMWHPWKPGPVGRTNELLALQAPFSGNPSILPLIERSLPLSQASEHLFNPAIGKLIALWGFHSDEPPQGPPPDPRAIAELVAADPKLEDIEIRGVVMRGTNPAVKLDFGAVAKGLAIDRGIEALQALGVAHAVINAGGDLKVIGRHGDRPWRVGIRNPRGEGVLAVLDVHDGEAVFTSGDYERYFTWEGKRYHHILDPRTGYPAEGTRSVTVIHTDGATADAAATALFVAGPDDWPRIAQRMGIDQVLLVDADGVFHLTPKMQARLKFAVEPPAVRVVAPLKTP